MQCPEQPRAAGAAAVTLDCGALPAGQAPSDGWERRKHMLIYIHGSAADYYTALPK
jgi:hypothetical protein